MLKQSDTAKAKKRLSLMRRAPHAWYGLVLPVYLIAFYLVERIVDPAACHAMYIPLDDRIPLLEGFVLPYMLWFPMLLCAAVFLFLKDPEGFKRYMVYIAVSFFSTLIFYCVYPNKQELRPESFPRENLCTWILSLVYKEDTSTNVCPSLHVIGAFAVSFAVWDSDALQGKKRVFWRWFTLISTSVIAVSTVFVKQHSVIDLLAAIPFSILVYLLVYKFHYQRRRSGRPHTAT